MSSNGKLCAVIAFNVFQKFICRWLGSVHDCYILQSRSVDDSFETFETSNIGEVVHESDEPEKLDSYQTTSRVEMIHSTEDKLLGFLFSSKNSMEDI